MIQSIGFSVLRFLYGALFIASAVLKLFPLDYFELILVEQLGLSWHVVPLLARVIILIEFAVGVSIMAGFKLRLSLIASLLMLVFFSGYLAIQIASGSGAENCGCFGELIPLDGPSSLIKNGVFFLMGLVLLLRMNLAQKWTLWLASPIIIVLAIPALFLVLPLPEFEPDADFKLDTELLMRNDPHPENAIDEGQKVVVIMLAKCIHCAQLGSLISTLDPALVDEHLRLLILGKTPDVEHFVEETNIQDFHYVRSGDSELLRSIGGTFPTVLLVEEGEVKNKWKGTSVNIALLSELLELK